VTNHVLQKLPKFQEYIEKEGLTAEQIFNADKTALYFKMLPDTTFAQMYKPKLASNRLKIGKPFCLLVIGLGV
jgi:hypothetical protein